MFREHRIKSHSYLRMFISQNFPRRIKKKGNNENDPEWIKKAHNQSSENQEDVVKAASGSALTIKSQNDGEME